MTKMSGRRPCLQSNPPDSCQPGRPLRLGASDAQAEPLREQIARFLSARPAVTPQCIRRTGRTTAGTDCPIPVSPAVRYASVHPTHRQNHCENRLPDSFLPGRLLRLSASDAQAGQLQEQIARFLSARLSVRLSASCAQAGQVREPNRPTDAGRAGPTPHVTRCTDTTTTVSRRRTEPPDGCRPDTSRHPMHRRDNKP